MIMHERQGKEAMQVSSINYNYSKVTTFWAVGLRSIVFQQMERLPAGLPLC